MKDTYAAMQPSLTSPLLGGFEIAPTDGIDLQQITRSIYVGQAGDLAVVFADGTAATIRNVQAGTLYPLRLRRVKATGTSAQHLVGLV